MKQQLQANPYACIAAGIASLWGPAHGGANEAPTMYILHICIHIYLSLYLSLSIYIYIYPEVHPFLF